MYRLNKTIGLLAKTSGQLFECQISQVLSKHAMKKYPLSTQSVENKTLTSERMKEIDFLSSPLIHEDLKQIHIDIKRSLRASISNDELYRITTHYFTKFEDPCGTWNVFSVLAGKALHVHLFNEGRLSPTQRKVVALSDMIMTGTLLHDDMVDNDRERQGLPAAHVRFHPQKVVFAGNALFATTVTEAAKLGDDVMVTLCQMNEMLYRGQCMAFEASVPDGDLLGHYLTKSDYKFACGFQATARALSQCVGGGHLLGDAMARLGFNYGMYSTLIDDIDDLEKDLRAGFGTAPVILACREHPDLEKMLLRRFRGNGDVERSIELVKDSNGMREAKILAGRYITEARKYLNMLIPSPYRTALEEILRYHMEVELGLNSEEKIYD